MTSITNCILNAFCYNPIHRFFTDCLPVYSTFSYSYLKFKRKKFNQKSSDYLKSYDNFCFSQLLWEENFQSIGNYKWVKKYFSYQNSKDKTLTVVPISEHRIRQISSEKNIEVILLSESQGGGTDFFLRTALKLVIQFLFWAISLSEKYISNKQ